MNQSNIRCEDYVISICDTRLKEVFPVGIPEEVRERYERELQCMRENDAAKDIYAY